MFVYSHWCVLLGALLLHSAQGVPTLKLGNCLLESGGSTSVCITQPTAREQMLLCESQQRDPDYTWYHCDGHCEEQENAVQRGDHLSLDPNTLQEGLYRCEVNGDGSSSVIIQTHTTRETVTDDRKCFPEPLHCNTKSVIVIAPTHIIDGPPRTNASIIIDPSGNNSVSIQTEGRSRKRESWKTAYIITCSVIGFLLLLTALLVPASVFSYRKWKSRAGHDQTEDYAAMENLEVDTFHSIPYRRDGLPECPISIYTDGGGGSGVSGKRGRFSITWPPSTSQRSSCHAPSSTSPSMTWYYSRGQPLPILPGSGTSDTDGDDCHLLMVDSQESSTGSTKRWGVVVTEEDGWQGVEARRREREGQQQGKKNKVELSEAVSVDQFEKAVASKYKDSMLGFQTEFMSLYSGTEKSVSVAQRRDNRSKNCFSNFYPYDDCRVVLQPVPVHGHRASTEHNDYINASYIDGCSKSRKFIATQVPLPHTVIDFWQMVWQERASCLVLLTLNKEEGRGMPGERYCSDDIGTWCIGPFLVSTTHKTQCAHHTIRHISVQVPGSAPVEVCQLQITHLSRQSVRHMASTLLSFHRRFTELTSNPSNKQPTIIHCSTGAGLTGVFVAVDRLLEEVKAGPGGGVNVWGVVNSLRQQRPRMVATMEQYVLIHEVLLEWVRWGNTEIPVCRLTTATTGLRGERLEKLFKAAGPVEPVETESEQEAGCMSFAHPLWITHTAPAEQSSASILAQSRTVPYHRPTSISGYWQGGGWLVTNSPTRSSLTQFWRSVVNKKCSIIVDLSPSDGKEKYQYWPDGVSSATLIAGQYAVHRGREEGGEKTGARTVKSISLTIENLLSGQTHVVSQFLVLDWTGDSCLQLCGAVETILRAQNSSIHIPVLLHCSDGVRECGVVCVVMMAVEQGLAEGLVDIPSAVRRVRSQLPSAVSSMDEMELVVKTVATLLNRKLR